MVATLHWVMYLHVTDLRACHVKQPFGGLVVLSYPYTWGRMGRRIEIILMVYSLHMYKFLKLQLLETGPLPSANCFAECQKSGTRQRPSFPGSRQKRGTRHRLPCVTVFGHVLLCRVPAVRHSAKIFFFENTLPSAPDTALSKDSIFFLKCLCRVPID